MIESYKSTLKKYVDFEGCATRSEYWYFALGNFVIMFVVGIIMGIFNPSGVDAASAILQLALFLPSVAVGVRRMHDSNHSGWWLLVPVVGFIFLFFPTTDSKYAI